MTRFLLPVVWLIISTILLTLPGTAFPREDWLDKIWFDKWVHVILFFVMIILWNWAIASSGIPTKTKNASNSIHEPGTMKTIFFFITMVFFVYGIGIEFVQHFLIPNRSFDWGDILADAAGCGAGFVYSTSRYIKK